VKNVKNIEDNGLFMKKNVKMVNNRELQNWFSPKRLQRIASNFLKNIYHMTKVQFEKMNQSYDVVFWCDPFEVGPLILRRRGKNEKKFFFLFFSSKCFLFYKFRKKNGKRNVWTLYVLRNYVIT